MYNVVLQRKQNLKEINHKYLIPGHTHLECDSDHAIIERARKRHDGAVAVPQDWMMIVRMSGKHLIVVPMRQNDFFSFSSLMKDFLVRRTMDIIISLAQYFLVACHQGLWRIQIQIFTNNSGLFQNLQYQGKRTAACRKYESVPCL